MTREVLFLLNISMRVVDIGNKYIRLVTVYRPPPLKKNSTSTSMFFDEFSSVLEELAAWTSPLLICGDFNIHMDDGLMLIQIT